MSRSEKALGAAEGAALSVIRHLYTPQGQSGMAPSNLLAPIEVWQKTSVLCRGCRGGAAVISPQVTQECLNGRAEMIRKFTLLAVAAGMASPAIAAPVPEVGADGRLQVIVSYADLDLASTAGAAAMQHRIRTAVRVVCPIIPGVAQVGVRMAEMQCASETSQRANRQVDQLIADAKAGRLASSYRVAVR
jgi:UrcA family protein